MYGSMDENDTLQFVREFAAKDSQQSETWVADFLTYLMTGKSTIIVMPGKAGHLPDATRLMGWHDNVNRAFASLLKGQATWLSKPMGQFRAVA